jgi:hypothetical protein
MRGMYVEKQVVIKLQESQGAALVILARNILSGASRFFFLVSNCGLCALLKIMRSHFYLTTPTGASVTE